MERSCQTHQPIVTHHSILQGVTPRDLSGIAIACSVVGTVAERKPQEGPDCQPTATQPAPDRPIGEPGAEEPAELQCDGWLTANAAEVALKAYH